MKPTDEEVFDSYTSGMEKSTNKHQTKKENKIKFIRNAIAALGTTLILLASNVPHTLKEGRNKINDTITTESSIPMELMGKNKIDDIVNTALATGALEGFSDGDVATYLEGKYNIGVDAYNEVTKGKKITKTKKALAQYKAYLLGKKVKGHGRGGI